MKSKKPLPRVLKFNSRILCLFLGVCLPLSCFGQKFNGIKELASKTEFQKLPAGVKEIWNLPVKAEEIGQIIPVNDNRVLFQTISFEKYWSGPIFFYKYSNLILVNLENGKQIWSFPTSELGQKSQNVITVSPVILLLSSSENTASYVAVNPESGLQVWKQQLNGKTSYNFSSDGQSMFISYIDNGIWTIEKVAINDGKSKWKSILSDADSKNALYSYFIPGNDLSLVIGNKIFTLNDENGSIRWQFNNLKSIQSCLNTPDYLWVYNNQTIDAVEHLTGKTNYEFSIPGKNIISAVVYDKSLFASVYDSVNKYTAIHCFDLTNHKTLWEFEVKDGIKSSLYKGIDFLYFTGNKAFYNIDQASGRLRTMIQLPDSFDADYLAPDDIWKINDRYVINRENSVIIISEPGNSVVSDYSFGISGGFTTTYMQNTLQEIGKVPTTGKGSALTPSSGNYYTNYSLYSMARQNQAYVYSRTAPIIASNSNASYNEKMSALGQREASAQATLSMGRAQAEMQYMTSAAQFGATIGNSIGTMLQSASNDKMRESDRHEIDFMLEKIKTCTLYRANSIIGNLYFRPYFKSGWNLVFIDINKPGYVKVPMIPDLVPFHYYDTRSIAYCVINQGGRMMLVAKVYKPVPEEQEPFKFGYFDNKSFKVDRWEMPRPQIACYDISRMQTSTSEILKEPFPSVPRSQDLELIDAAGDLNTDKVTDLIKKGANVNATDRFGHTALMHACQHGDYKITKLLVKSGANPKLEDPEGLNAVDYLNLSIYPKSMDVKELTKMQKLFKKASDKFD